MTTSAALLQDLAARGVVLTAESGRLRYRAPAGALTPDLWRQLEAHKAALVALLSAQQTSLFDGAAPSPDAVASQAPQDGASAPDLAEPDSRQIAGSAGRPRAARGHDLPQDPHAGRLVLTDFERARQRLAELEAEIDAGAASLADLPQVRWPAELVTRLDALAREALKLAPVADYFNLQDLETATGAAYQAVASNPTDPAALERYRRLDDAWAAVLGLPELPHEVPNVT